jgi:hypothetical protein
MTGIPLRHLVFTNVTGTNRVGFRVHLSPWGWTRGDAEWLTAWLAALGRRRISPTLTGWAAATFHADGTLWSAVGCVPAGWRYDALSRDGALLVHGLCTPVAEETVAGAAVHAIPMLESLNAIAVPPEVGVEAYLAACDRALESSGPAPDPVALVREVHPAELSAFLSCAASGALAGETAPGAEYADAMTIAKATSALPPRLRSALRWSVGLSPADPAGISAPTLSPTSPGVTQRYDVWLRNAIAGNRADELGCVLRDWDRARSWQTLIQWVDPEWARRA